MTSSGAGPSSGCTPPIYSHGHIDHVFGVAPWEAEAAEQGWPAPVVVAHEALPRRFDRYIADRRLQRDHQPAPVRRPRPALADRVPLPGPHLPDELTASRSAARRSRCGTRRARPTTTPSPGWPSRKVLCCGDLFIWASPNAGQPAEGAALPAGMGPGAAPDDGAAAGVPAARSRPAGDRRGPGAAGPHRHRRAAGVARRARRWRS